MSPQNWDGGGEYKAKPLEWVKLCQSNIGFGALRRACGPHLRGRKTAQEAVIRLEPHSHPDSGSGPPEKAGRGRNSCSTGLLSHLGPKDHSPQHSRAKTMGRGTLA